MLPVLFSRYIFAIFFILAHRICLALSSFPYPRERGRAKERGEKKATKTVFTPLHRDILE
jgi:hypothetical protein